MIDQKILAWLQARHDEVMASEAAALEALSRGDITAYATDMRKKATLLAALAEEYSKFASVLPDRKILEKLEQFSANAATALELDSVFYMSALLYRDDHKKGEPDNFEVFIRDLNQAR